MFNKSMLVVSGVAFTVGAVGTIGISKVVKNVKKFTDRKKRESEVLQILKRCIDEETDFCISVGMIDTSSRNEVLNKIYKDSVEFLKTSKEFDAVLEMNDEEIYKQLKDSLKQSRSVYAMYGLFA